MTIEVFGITGTNGKTTVSYMLKSILEEAGRECGLIGTITHIIGKNQYESLNTTPSKELMKKYLYELSEQGIHHCVMEISSHGLDQGRIDGTEIQYSGFTNLTQDHLDYHITMENYYKAKERLFLITKKGISVNIDDPYGKRIFARVSELKQTGMLPADLKVQSYSIQDDSADFYGKLLENTLRGIVMELFEKGVSWGPIKIGLAGITTAYNSTLAMAMARQAGIDKNAIILGIEKLQGVSGRFQYIENQRGMDVIVDFAHTPDALENVLKLASELNKGRLICVFGCGGNRDKEKRSIMGKIAGQYSNYCIITSDNPRYENPQFIVEAIEEGIKSTECDYAVIIDRREAIKGAIDFYEAGDLIVIAGKGHEKYQIINGDKMPFDDGQIAQELMKMKE